MATSDSRFYALTIVRGSLNCGRHQRKPSAQVDADGRSVASDRSNESTRVVATFACETHSHRTARVVTLQWNRNRGRFARLSFDMRTADLMSHRQISLTPAACRQTKTLNRRRRQGKTLSWNFSAYRASAARSGFSAMMSMLWLSDSTISGSSASASSDGIWHVPAAECPPPPCLSIS